VILVIIIIIIIIITVAFSLIRNYVSVSTCRAEENCLPKNAANSSNVIIIIIIIIMVAISQNYNAADVLCAFYLQFYVRCIAYILVIIYVCCNYGHISIANIKINI